VVSTQSTTRYERDFFFFFFFFRENPGLKNNRWGVDITTNRSMLLVPYICILFF
jgi:hypothetical protein